MEDYKTVFQNMDRRPHIRLEVIEGVLHQRLVFDNPGDMEIRPEECVLYNDGKKSPGCTREEFKPYVSELILCLMCETLLTHLTHT